ncbi:Clp protease N-terminal domain-containing protein [Arthrobacter ginkgonis]|uniref:Clp protease N-terminal domain-containing protein n=1 Tax=Arthrobacter ginkgonis TaxID=1630594 RepID=UPI0031F01874
MVTAVEEAQTLQSERVVAEHLLLGLLRQAGPDLTGVLSQAGITRELLVERLTATAKDRPLGTDDAEALRSIGIDLDAVNRSLETNFGPKALERAAEPKRRGWGGLVSGAGHIPFSPEAKKSLELSLREAIAHQDKTIQETHLALGILHASGSAMDIVGGRAPLDQLRIRIKALQQRAS